MSVDVRTAVDELLLQTRPAGLRDEIVNMLLRTGALLTDGHYSLKSGLHSDQFIQFSALVKFPLHVVGIAEAIASELNHVEVDCIIVPNNAATVLGYELALQLSAKVSFVSLGLNGYPEEFSHNFMVPEGQRALLLVDVITTGRSLVFLDRLCAKHGIKVVGAATFAERGLEGASMDLLELSCPKVNRAAVATFQLNHYSGSATECPRCRDGVLETSFWDLQRF